MEEPPELQELRERDAPERARESSRRGAYHQELVNEYSRMRKEALAELVASGWVHRDLAELLDMSRGRISQLLKDGPAIERALLGTGALTVAIGGKPEAPKKGSKSTSTMISDESSRAYELIAETARTHRLDVTRETVPPPGILDLNRSNLIVIGSPRLLPLVGQMLASDPHLGFGNSEEGWHLVEKQAGVIYRSPSDEGEDADYAYLGRVPRPDGRGTFLYLAGIHAMGTLGAATYLTGQLGELYGEVKNRRFSVLLRCHYNPDSTPRAIEEVTRATKLYVS